jgi:hypothetical protein
MSARRRRAASTLGAAIGLALAALAAAADGWVDAFGGPMLDLARWEQFVDGDVREWSADLVPAPPGFRLRLRLDTRDTRDDTVKHAGVTRRETIALGEGARLTVRLDWGNQANGSYLAAAVVLTPHAAPPNPLAAPDWLAVGYVGVPPGHNARMVVRTRKDGRDRTVYTEGWPDTNRTGRRIGVQEISVTVHGRALEVWEGDRAVWRSEDAAVPLPALRLGLVLSSHSNFPARAVYVERVEYAPGSAGPASDHRP